MRLTVKSIIGIVLFCSTTIFYVRRSHGDKIDATFNFLNQTWYHDVTGLDHQDLHSQDLPPAVISLWSSWAQILVEAKPQARPITLSANAHGTRVEPGERFAHRTPYSNYVSNTGSDVAALYESHVRIVRTLERLVDIHGAFSGRGIVIVGGGEYFGPVIVSLHMLRRARSDLPVEVFIPTEDEYEAELCENYLPGLGARCVVLSRVFIESQSDTTQLPTEHYQFKSLALLLSSFSEVLMLDSDNMPLINPAELFDSEPYRRTGLITWPDFWHSTESPIFWTDVAGLPTYPNNLPITCSEAGQLLVNKATHLKSLLLSTYYNVYGPDYYYPLQSQGALGQGDKETFLAAAVVLNQTWYHVRTLVGYLGRHDGTKEKGTAMIQYFPEDQPAEQSAREGEVNDSPHPRAAFLHSNTPKMNAGHLVDEGDLVDSNGKHLRLLGSRKDQLTKLGDDVEMAIWQILVRTGCELGSVLREWKHRKDLCARLREHYAKVFNEGT